MTVTPQEITRYEAVRQRLRALAVAHPWLLEVSIAVHGRQCQACRRRHVVEHPADSFRCKDCGHTWEVTPLPPRVRHREYL
jgi:hypothetical protein